MKALIDVWKYWRAARPLKGTAFEHRFVLRMRNRALARLAREIRATEKKLNKPHRYQPRLGCVQYMGEAK